MKKIILSVLLILGTVMLIVLAGRLSQSLHKSAMKPHIFYNNSIYFPEQFLPEYDLGELIGSLEEDGTIYTLIAGTEVCSDNYSTNSELFMDATIYKQKNGSFRVIYVRLAKNETVLLRFDKYEKED